MTNRIQLHLVRKRSFAGQKTLALDVAVNHDDRRCIVIQITDNHRHRVKSGNFTSALSPVTGDNLITAFFPWTDNRRNKNSVFPDALSRIQHSLIVLHLEGMISERMKLNKRYFCHLLASIICPTFFRGEDVIVRSQT